MKVVPQFESLFQGFGAELPVFTQMVVRLSEWMQSWWFVVLLSIVGTIFTFKEAVRRSQKFSDLVDRLVLKLPVVGEILDKSAVAKFGRVLSTTFAAGVPLVDRCVELNTRIRARPSRLTDLVHQVSRLVGFVDFARCAQSRRPLAIVEVGLHEFVGDADRIVRVLA